MKKCLFCVLTVAAVCVIMGTNALAQQPQMVPVMPQMPQQMQHGTPSPVLVPPNNGAWEQGWTESFKTEHTYRPLNKPEYNEGWFYNPATQNYQRNLPAQTYPQYQQYPQYQHYQQSQQPVYYCPPQQTMCYPQQYCYTPQIQTRCYDNTYSAWPWVLGGPAR
jgi:hypothetical protein